MDSNLAKKISQAPKLTYEQIIEDLTSIPINEDDVIFSSKLNSILGKNESTNELTDEEIFYKRLENYVLFKANLESDDGKNKSELSLDSVTENLKSLETSIKSLQHFIEISEKLKSLKN